MRWSRDDGADGTVGMSGAASPGKAKSIGFLHDCHMGKWENVRLEFRAMFMLSVLAMGRRVLDISARLKAGRGDVEDGVGVDDAMLPAEERRVISAARLARQQPRNRSYDGAFEKEDRHTTRRTIPPLHNRMSSHHIPIPTIAHRRARIAQTAREHIQTHASGRHIHFDLLLDFRCLLPQVPVYKNFGREDRYLKGKNAPHARFTKSFVRRRCEL